MMEAAEKAGVMCAVLHCMHWSPALASARAAVAAGVAPPAPAPAPACPCPCTCIRSAVAASHLKLQAPSAVFHPQLSLRRLTEAMKCSTFK